MPGGPYSLASLVTSKWVGSLAAPWNPDVGTAPRTPDRMVQRRLYQAYVEAFSRHDWWRGFSVYGMAGFLDSGYVLDSLAVDYLKRLPVRGALTI